MACKAGGRKQKFRGKHVDRVIVQLLNGELQGSGHRSSRGMPANDVYGGRLGGHFAEKQDGKDTL